MVNQFVQRLVFIGVIGLASLSVAQTKVPPRTLEGQAARRAGPRRAPSRTPVEPQTPTRFCVTTNGNIGELSMEAWK